MSIYYPFFFFEILNTNYNYKEIICLERALFSPFFLFIFVFLLSSISLVCALLYSISTAGTYSNKQYANYGFLFFRLMTSLGKHQMDSQSRPILQINCGLFAIILKLQTTETKYLPVNVSHAVETKGNTPNKKKTKNNSFHVPQTNRMSSPNMLLFFFFLTFCCFCQSSKRTLNLLTAPHI